MKPSEALIHINAYRLGTVPQRLGADQNPRPSLDQPLDLFLTNLKSGTSSTLLIQGVYGSGKSHALNLLKTKCLKAGYVVAHLCLDATFNLSQPEQFYYHFMHGLHAPTTQEQQGFGAYQGAAFEDFFSLWIDNLRNSPNRNLAAHDIQYVIDDMTRYHDTFSQSFLEYIRASLIGDHERATTIAAWLKGDSSLSAQAKKPIGVKGNVDRTLSLDFFQAFLHLLHLMGYPGCVMLIDELDLLNRQRSDRRDTAFSNLRQLIDMQQGGNLELFGMVLAGTPDVFVHAETGFLSHPPLAQRLMLLPGGSYQKPPLAAIDTPDIQELYSITDQVITTYSIAYDLKLSILKEHLCHLVLMDFKKQRIAYADINVRRYIQNLVGFLDDVKRHPNQKLLTLKTKFTLDGNGEMQFISTLT